MFSPRDLLLSPANEVCEGYVFTGVCLSTGGGEHAWQWGCVWQGRGGWGACMDAWQGGCAWQGGMHGRGVCLAGGVCMAGGMHGRQICVAGGVCGRGVCMECMPPGRYYEIWSMSGW